MSASITRDEWIKALGDAAAVCDPDALTVVEIAEQCGATRQGAYKRIRELLEKGRAVQTFKMIQTAGGYAKRVPAYKLVPAPKGKK